MKLIAILSLLWLSFTTSAQTNEGKGAHHFAGKKFKVAYPQSWTLDTSRMMGTDLIIFSQLESDSDKFKENVNVLVQDLRGKDLDLDMYMKLSEKQIKDLATEGVLYESGILNSGNGKYGRMVYAMTQGTLKLKILCYCFIRDEKAYVVTFTAAFEKFDKFKSDGEQILNSFVLTK